MEGCSWERCRGCNTVESVYRLLGSISLNDFTRFLCYRINVGYFWRRTNLQSSQVIIGAIANLFLPLSLHSKSFSGNDCVNVDIQPSKLTQRLTTQLARVLIKLLALFR